MSETTAPSQTDGQATEPGESPEQSIENSELAAQVDLLAAENRRLRDRLAERQQSRYRDTALGLIGVGLLCGIFGYFTPAASTVLFALAGTGLFAGVLTYFLTPERFISADVGQRVYSATAQSFARLCDDLGLSNRRIYLAAHTDGATTESDLDSRLFIPQTQDTEIPAADAFDSAFLVEDDRRGLAVQPTGGDLVTAIRDSLTEPFGDTPEMLCSQLTDAIIEDLELAKSAEYDIDQADGRVSVQFTGALYGDGTQFDHPIVSVMAVGLAAGLQTAIETTVTESDPLAVTFRWEPQHGDEDQLN